MHMHLASAVKHASTDHGILNDKRYVVC